MGPSYRKRGTLARSVRIDLIHKYSRRTHDYPSIFSAFQGDQEAAMAASAAFARMETFGTGGNYEEPNELVGSTEAATVRSTDEKNGDATEAGPTSSFDANQVSQLLVDFYEKA